MTAPAPAPAPLDLLEKFYLLERGRPFVPEPWQREFFARLYERGEDGRRRHSLALLEIPKKCGKTETAAAVAFRELLDGEPEGEILFIANSREQATALAFDRLKRAIRRGPAAKLCKVQSQKITCLRNGTTAEVLPCSAGAVAGRNPTLTLFDELWALPDEEVFYQLTETPAREDPLTLITTYPGYDYASLLYRLHQQGEAGEDPRMLHFYRPGLRSSWVTDKYLESQRRRLPPHVYQRLHEALWVGGANAAWTREQVMACVDEDLWPQSEGVPGRAYFCGVDAGLRRDRTAAAVVSWASPGRLELADMEVWFPGKGAPVQLGEVETWLSEAAERFPGLRVVADPTFLEGTIQRGVGGITEARFTAELVRRLSMNLYEMIAGRRLALYPHETLLDELLTVNVVSTNYGWRLDHQGGKHDDTVIALGLAALEAAAARAAPQRAPHVLYFATDLLDEDFEDEAAEVLL
jgi:hypothetical protein